MVLLESVKIPLNSGAFPFTLKGIDEKEYRLESYQGKKAVCLIFTCNHCPYAQGLFPRLIDLKKKYENEAIEFFAINPNIHPDYPEDSMENMKKYANEISLNFPYLIDETQEVAKAYQAQCTPDVYLYDSNLKLVYHGRVDDNWQNPEYVTRRDLNDAIFAMLRGEKVSEEQYPSMGCSIKWRNEK